MGDPRGGFAYHEDMGERALTPTPSSDTKDPRGFPKTNLDEEATRGTLRMHHVRLHLRTERRRPPRGCPAGYPVRGPAKGLGLSGLRRGEGHVRAGPGGCGGVNAFARQCVVVGTGVAGVEAALSARQRDPSCRIRLIGSEDTSFYARIRLGEVVAGRTPPDRLVLKDPKWFGERDIDLALGVRAEGLDPAVARVRLSTGEWVPYDALLLATGAVPFLPPIPGVDREGVLSLRDMTGAIRLRERALRSATAVVIGGGLLGIEVAAALRQNGLSVTVVETAPWLLPRQLDREGAAVVQRHLEARGLIFLLGAQVRAVLGEPRVQAVALVDGATLEADLVLVAAGVRPEVSLAREAGIVWNRGIVVDDRLATSAPGVFAAGDCAEHRGRVYGIWPAAEAQGRAAGAAMTGGEVRYEGTVPSTTLKVTDLPVLSAGDLATGEGRIEEVSQGEGVYRKLVRDADGRLVGAILVGDLSERRSILRALENRQRYPSDP